MAEWIPPGGARLGPPGRRTASAANPDAFPLRPVNVQRQQTSPRFSRQGALPPLGTAFLAEYGPEAEQDEKNSYIVAKRQPLTGICP
jgi:hypothetical protein